MLFVRKIWRASRVAFFALMGWLTVYGVALAQQQKPGEKPSVQSNTYVFSYIVVLLGIAAGVLFVCRASNRRDRAKPEQFNDSKGVKKEE